LAIILHIYVVFIAGAMEFIMRHGCCCLKKLAQCITPLILRSQIHQGSSDK